MKNIGLLFIVFLFITIGSITTAQTESKYNPEELFGPLNEITPGNVYRSGSGQPGPAYWQNENDYNISARLDEKENKVSVTEEIVYTNNSPDNLNYVWLALDQNRFKEDSRSRLTSGPVIDRSKLFIGGFKISSVKVEQNGDEKAVDYIISDTRMQIRLKSPLKAKGDRLKIKFDYSFKVPPQRQGRSGMMKTKNGIIYEIAQWFPRMEVYDDLKGWNILPFLGSGEFFFDYGNYDVSINVPSDMIVVSSGKLINADDVLTGNELDRFEKASQSSSTVVIRTLAEVKNSYHKKSDDGRLTWKFKMQNSRDFSWAASKAFIWDGAKVSLPGGAECMAMSVYPEESSADTSWRRSTDFLKKSIEIYSRDWYVYPYPTAVNVAGPVGGMEYPGIIFCHWSVGGKILWQITTHEIGHDWFPMIVGSNERENAWMDEGFNTFINIYSTDEYNSGEFAPKRDNEYAPKGGNPAREIVPYLLNPKTPPIMSYPDQMQGSDVHPLEYYKTALGLVLLRNNILGKDRFNYAFKEYIRRWAFKHPSPDDFFRSMNDASGENLNWFWKEWFVKKWTLDQAVKDVKYAGGDVSKGILITIENLDKMAMPANIKVIEANGKSGTVKLPVEIWERGGEWTFFYPSTSRVKSVTIDPDETLPDVNPDNNTWTADYNPKITF